MKKIKSKSFYLLALLSIFFIISVSLFSVTSFNNNVFAKEDSQNLTFVTGAGVRFNSGSTGLRFTCEISTSKYDEMIENDTYKDGCSFNMLIIPEDYFDGYDEYLTSNAEGDHIKYVESLNLGDKKVDLHFSTNKIIANLDHQSNIISYKIQGVITNILEKNYNRNFIAIAYVNNGDAYEYAVSDARNIVYVANRANKDISADYSEEQKDVLTYFIGKCSHTNTIEQGAIEATCTETGMTASVSCKDCEKIVTEGVEIPAKGHTDNYVIETAPTLIAVGTAKNICSVCETEIANIDLPKLSSVDYDYDIDTTTFTLKSNNLIKVQVQVDHTLQIAGNTYSAYNIDKIDIQGVTGSWIYNETLQKYSLKLALNNANINGNDLSAIKVGFIDLEIEVTGDCVLNGAEGDENLAVLAYSDGNAEKTSNLSFSGNGNLTINGNLKSNQNGVVFNNLTTTLNSSIWKNSTRKCSLYVEKEITIQNGATIISSGDFRSNANTISILSGADVSMTVNGANDALKSSVGTLNIDNSSLSIELDSQNTITTSAVVVDNLIVNNSTVSINGQFDYAFYIPKQIDITGENTIITVNGAVTTAFGSNMGDVIYNFHGGAVNVANSGRLFYKANGNNSFKVDIDGSQIDGTTTNANASAGIYLDNIYLKSGSLTLNSASIAIMAWEFNMSGGELNLKTSSNDAIAVKDAWATVNISGGTANIENIGAKGNTGICLNKGHNTIIIASPATVTVKNFEHGVGSWSAWSEWNDINGINQDAITAIDCTNKVTIQNW